MATIIRRGPYQWQAKIRRKGFPLQTKTFETKADAEDWATVVESEMVRDVFLDRSEAERTTLKEALERYLKEVTPQKKGRKQETNRIKALQRDPIAEKSLASIRSADIAKWRNERVKAGKAPTTIRNVMTIISQVYVTAQIEWGMEGLHNPVRGVPMPRRRQGRDRRLKEGEGDQESEETRLLKACDAAASSWVGPIVRLALETGMRQGEMLNLKWDDIQDNIAVLRDTKTNTPRTVPLSAAALSVLQKLKSGKLRSIKGRVFPITQDSLEYHFRKAVKKAGLEDFRFHDLRHEATSRFFERGFSALEVASITGHKTLEMLKRYTHFDAAKLAEKLG